MSKGAASAFVYTFAMKYFLSKTLFFVRYYLANPERRKKMNVIAELLGLPSNTDSVLFALAFALINGSYKMVLCLIRHFFRRKNIKGSPDRIASLIAGFASGLFMIIDPNRFRRNFITCLLLSRLTDILLNKWL